MTKVEEKTIENLNNLVENLTKTINDFRAEVKTRVENCEKKVERKHAPIELENAILSATQESVSKAISEALTRYDSPLVKLVREVVDSNTEFLRNIISSSFDQVIQHEDFKKSIINGFSHKVARTIISNNDGLFDKVSNTLKQDQTFRAKMTIAVANVVEECLNNKNE